MIDLERQSENLMATYHADEGKIIPDKQALIKIIEDVRTLLFPHHFRKEKINAQNGKELIKNRLISLRNELMKQLCLAYGCETNKNCKCDKPEKFCDDFIEFLPTLRKILDDDITATLNGDPAAENIDQIIFCYPGIYAISVYRIAHFFHERKVPVIPRILTEHAHSVTGIDIHPGAKIGRFFFIDHGTGIVIGETTVIGDHVKIYQGVTLGALSIKNREATLGKKRHPTICDNVTIYSNVSILGGDTIIGKNSIIGGSAFITHSIEENTKVSAELPKLTMGKRKHN